MKATRRGLKIFFLVLLFLFVQWNVKRFNAKKGYLLFYMTVVALSGWIEDLSALYTSLWDIILEEPFLKKKKCRQKRPCHHVMSLSYWQLSIYRTLRYIYLYKYCKLFNTSFYENFLFFYLKSFNKANKATTRVPSFKKKI